ncbi:MAG: PAS domain S-box protein [Lysobacteraceae bacterium]|nr:MAG: PAS domain S-box protein [Xanthomonadaceae bacterium]
MSSREEARAASGWPGRERSKANGTQAQSSLVRAMAGLLTVGIFLIDTLSTLEGAVAVLYVVAVLLVARTGRRGDIIAVAVAAIGLTIVAYVATHGLNHVGSQTLRALVSLAAIVITAVLALQNRNAMKTLSAQARLLDLSHDMIFVRDRSGLITFWNRTAEEAYGWSAPEALGRVADELLHTRYPQSREAIEGELFEQGYWNGILEQTTRAGDTLALDSRWVLQRDRDGRPVDVLETHTDITERKAAHAALVKSERRYRRMFDASRIGVVQQDWTALRSELAALALEDAPALGAHLACHPDLVTRLRKLIRIEDMNPAFLSMVADRTQAHPLASVDDILVDTDRTFPSALAAFVRGDSFHEGETEIVRADGGRLPVLFTITFPGDEDSDGCVLVFVVDITDRRKAQDGLLQAQAELAHAARVATLGELTASIAHEVNQPLMAVVTNGEAGMRWLRRETPDLHEVETAMERIVSEGRRAGEIVKRIRGFLSKGSTQRDVLDAASIIEEAARLLDHEFTREHVELLMEVEPGLPAIIGDRIQLQQVLVNLMVNASQAMAGQSQPRQLVVTARRLDQDRISIDVRDSGPGVTSGQADRLFDAFFTTKPQGMGMGLAICRTTVEAHGGQLSLTSAPGQGATFQMTLAVAPPGTST